MKNKQKELDVDFIGGQTPPTKEELLAISMFIKAEKEKTTTQKPRKKRNINNKKLATA